VPLFAAVAAGAVQAQNPIETDGDKYKVILENEKVRVLEYRDKPGDKTNRHDHPAFVLYALAPFECTLHLPDGTKINRTFKAGDVIYSDAQTHIGENVGTTPTHVIVVEIRPASK